LEVKKQTISFYIFEDHILEFPENEYFSDKELLIKKLN